MRRGTTEIKSIKIDGAIDISNVEKAVMTIAQGPTKIHSEVSMNDDGSGMCAFTPEQTINLRLGSCKEQIKFLTKDGMVLATDIIYDIVDGDVLNEEGF